MRTVFSTGGAMKRYEFETVRTASARREPWEAMEREGLTRAVLWNAPAPALRDWLALVDPSRTLLGLARDDGRLAGAFWVIPMGRCGTVHFVMFRPWRSDRVNLGRQAVRFIFEAWPVDALAAVFPAPYRHLYPFVEALGFSLWPESLPLACRMPTPKHPEKCADMRLALLCRGNAPQ